MSKCTRCGAKLISVGDSSGCSECVDIPDDRLPSQLDIIEERVRATYTLAVERMKQADRIEQKLDKLLEQPSISTKPIPVDGLTNSVVN